MSKRSIYLLGRMLPAAVGEPTETAGTIADPSSKEPVEAQLGDLFTGVVDFGLDRSLLLIAEHRAAP